MCQWSLFKLSSRVKGGVARVKKGENRTRPREVFSVFLVMIVRQGSHMLPLVAQPKQ